jgi:hypothetical protein
MVFRPLTAEAYVEALSSSDKDSTETDDSNTESESIKDEEDDSLIHPTQNVKARLSQKMALEVSLSSFRAEFMTQDHLEASFAI